jgi:hypothetical protein
MGSVRDCSRPARLSRWNRLAEVLALNVGIEGAKQDGDLPNEIRLEKVVSLGAAIVAAG